MSRVVSSAGIPPAASALPPRLWLHLGAQGKLDLGRVPAVLARYQADGRCVSGKPHLVIHGGATEINLAHEHRLERLHFQVRHHETTQPQMVERPVERLVITASIDVNLPLNEGQFRAQLQQELLSVLR